MSHFHIVKTIKNDVLDVIEKGIDAAFDEAVHILSSKFIFKSKKKKKEKTTKECQLNSHQPPSTS
jgi:hypothetical protein